MPNESRRHLAEMAKSYEPWPLGTNAMVRILAWPDYTKAEQVRRVLQASSRLFGHDDACLCLRYDASIDPPISQVTEIINSQLQMRPEFRLESKDINILIIDDDIPRDDWYRVGLTAFCAVGLNDENETIRAEFIRKQRCEKLFV
ncbi:MAG: hypothetical protein JXR76_31080 [Deltaproteobacteria bacterium]|nr:hypothetical protein [Deltaproteobacteria bacterium]